MNKVLANLLLTRCHICLRKLVPFALYKTDIARTCPSGHGDFFLQVQRGQNPAVYFKPLESDDMTEVPPLPQIIRKIVESGRDRLIIQCEQTGQVYSSMNEAVLHLKVNRSSLSQHLKGNYASVRGMTFIILGTTGGKVYEPPIRPHKVLKGPSKPKVPIRCNETGVEYSSLHEAAQALGISRSNISHQLRGSHKTVGGYTFTRLSQELHGL